MTNEEILAALRQNESSGGTNFNHPTITHGISKGTNAIGNWGLTAATVDDTVKNDPNFAYLTKMNPAQKKQFLEANPEVEKAVANQLVNQLQNRYQGDPSKIAYAWNHGTYIDPNKITPNVTANDVYTSKFNRLTQKLGQNPEQLASNVPQSPQNSEKLTKNLPTNNASRSLEDIINDPANPFAHDFEDKDESEEDESKPKLTFNY